ncbi:MAG: L-seryl-tRNA(Sec) selenium transferase [Bacillota bacterium]
MGDKQNLLRSLPSVNELAEEGIKVLKGKYSFRLMVEAARYVLKDARNTVIDKGTAFNKDELLEKLSNYLEAKATPSLKQVINGTGIVLHTNLGRSVLSEKAQEAVQRIIKGYCNLEIDLVSGKRGSRYSHVEQLLVEMTGAEAALVVNNNAAAVFLVLLSLAKGKGVIVSRGQLVEIGGSFRVPEIMAASGARLVEVGTTNKTKLADYEMALTEDTALILKVHTSNYRIVGFTEEVPLDQLSALGKAHDIPVVEDLGSGFFVNLQEWGICDEPSVQQSVAEGADVVCFSGDKLLGGPQAGIIVGKKQYIDVIKKNPLNRALRVDKMTLAALEATLREYIFEENHLQSIPTLKMLTVSNEELKVKADELVKLLNSSLEGHAEIAVDQDFSEAGGGSLPTTKLPTWVVRLKPLNMTLNALVDKLRTGDPAVLARISDDRIIFDVRTIEDDEFVLLKDRLCAEMGKG